MTGAPPLGSASERFLLFTYRFQLNHSILERELLSLRKKQVLGSESKHHKFQKVPETYKILTSPRL